MKKVLLIMLVALMSLPAMARNFTYEYEGQTLTYTVIDKTAMTCQLRAGTVNYPSATTVGNYSISGDLIIPEVAEDGDNKYTVVAIPEFAFCFSEIESISLPSTITSIGDYAFYACSDLTSVSIPSGVTSIGECAFCDCSGLTSVSIPSSVTSIGRYAFLHCSGLTKAEFASIEALCKIAFRGIAANPLYCANNLYISGKEVTNLIISESVTTISSFTFCGCSGLTAVSIPESVTSIGDYAFYQCSGLTSVSIPSSVTSIGECVFDACFGLTSVSIPSSVTSIGAFMFYRCSGLTSVTIPSSVTSIGRNAFDECSGLTSVTIPESVTSIGGCAFSGCSGLTSVTIPSGVTSIGECAFYGCSGLTAVYYAATEPLSFHAGIFSDDAYPVVPSGAYADDAYPDVSGGAYANATLYVPAKAVEKCKEIEPWKYFARIEACHFTGIDEVNADFDENKPYEIYRLNGVKVGDSIKALAPGLYIVRQGSAGKKIFVK